MMAMPTDAAALDDSADRFELAQQQALEMLFQQCVDEIYAGELTALDNTNTELAVSPQEAASFMDFLAQACEDASDQLQEVSPSDVAKKLADVVAATQQSLRDVQSSVQGLLHDPTTMQSLCQQFDAADEQIKLLKHAHAAEQALLMGADPPPPPPLVANPTKDQALALPSNEESLRSMMQFADTMCGVLDNALNTISKDEYELAAQLSLGIAQKMLEAGQSLFMSIGDDLVEKSDRSDRITIEELDDEEPIKKLEAETTDAPKKEKRESIAAKRLLLKREQRKQATAVRTYVMGIADKAQKGAAGNPAAAAAIGMITLPFIGLVIPVASTIGLAVVLEKYYPELMGLTLEMLSNFVQMAKLWLLLVKISARQLLSVAKQCAVSWHAHAEQHGYVATGKELVTTGCSLGWLCVSYLYNSAVAYARPSA